MTKFTKRTGVFETLHLMLSYLTKVSLPMMVKLFDETKDIKLSDIEEHLFIIEPPKGKEIHIIRSGRGSNSSYSTAVASQASANSDGQTKVRTKKKFAANVTSSSLAS